MSAFANRLTKNFKHQSGWAARFPCNAFRIYDRDIPEYAVTVDYYAGKFVVCRYFNPRYQERDDLRFVDVLTAIKEQFEVSETDIFIKERQRQKGLDQYERLNRVSVTHWVEENALKFLVNLSDYLDTGLFLDHRLSRRWVAANSADKRVLNLFCYTGSVSVHAAAGGAREVTSVDMSATYLDWAAMNLEKNGFSSRVHPLIRADVCAWLNEPHSGDKFDLIFLDPPSFSNSKKMKEHFDVQKDHRWMIERCMERLAPQGTLFFSTNLRSFALDADVLAKFVVDDITKSTLPPDFRNELIHKAWLIRFSK